jgi:purine-cytosine permease-like protein
MTRQDQKQQSIGLELNGINIIDEAERKGAPWQLFWPWFAANISVLGLSYGAYVLDSHISFWQAVIVGIVGIVLSFVLCGFVSLAGKRGSAPTMILSRAAFGVNGNKLPTFLSWLLLMGWETVLTAVGTMATAALFSRMGWHDGVSAKIAALVFCVALIVGGGILGFEVIMRMQRIITLLSIVLTVGFIALTVNQINWGLVSKIPAGSTAGLIGATVFVITGFGLGWTNSAADFSRYLPRGASGRGVVGWTTLGGSLGPVFLLIFGLLLAGSNHTLRTALGDDSIGALATILPAWYLVPFAIVTVLGIVGGAVLNTYSSGLALLALGLRMPRYVAATLHSTLMILGTIYIVFFAHSFVGPFEGFLTTLGVPIAAWCGVMLADIALRRQPYAEPELYMAEGRYGSVQWPAVILVIVGTVAGWGLVTSTSASWLTWQGYLLSAVGLGGKTGAWSSANIGVLVALAVAFVGWLALGRRRVREQESAPETYPQVMESV